MSAIWHRDDTGWRLLSPSGFPDEASLHELVEQAPHIMPLAGSPQLVVVGREVLLGGNYADLIAVEPSGRVAVIEIKLARNAEARRAVIAQILTYASYLRGLDVATLERDVLGEHLARRGYQSLLEAVTANDQVGSVDSRAFAETLEQSLGVGGFRLVLVLDEAPEELVRLVGYLEAVADKLVIDLVTVSSYDVSGAKVVVPQRVDPEVPRSRPTPAATGTSEATGRYVTGADDFEEAIAGCPDDQQPLLRRLTDWAKGLEREGLVKLGTYHGTRGVLTLLPRLRADNAGMVTVWNDRGPYLQFWRSVIERRAPSVLPRIEELAAPAKVGQGTTLRAPSDELLAALTDAYREAASGQVRLDPPATVAEA